MKIVIGLLKLILKIVAAPVVVVLTVAIWMCVGIVYVSGLVLGLISMVITVLGVAVLITYSPQNGIILLVIAFLPAATGLLATGKSARFQICNTGFCLWIKRSPLHSRKGYRALRFD